MAEIQREQSDRLEYSELTEHNLRFFKNYIPDSVRRGFPEGEYGYGVMYEYQPKGVILLSDSGGAVTIKSLNTDITPAGVLVCKSMLKMVYRQAEKKGLKRIECLFTDDEPGITEDFLRMTGFTGFKEISKVYRISAGTLGAFLLRGSKPGGMRDECVDLLNEDRLRNFELADNKISEKYKNLYPVSDLSYVILDEKGEEAGYFAVSSLPDGSLYLADFQCKDFKNAGGLLFIGLGSVFLKIEPDGDFYIAAVNDEIRKLAEAVFMPIKSEIETQKIFLATREIK